MKYLLIISVCLLGLYSCSREHCVVCDGCTTKSDTQFCEEEFQKEADYNYVLDMHTSDGCDCRDK